MKMIAAVSLLLEENFQCCPKQIDFHHDHMDAQMFTWQIYVDSAQFW